MTIHEGEIAELNRLVDKFVQAASPAHSQEAQIALSRIFTALSYEGGVQLDEVKKIVARAGDIFSKLNPQAGAVLSKFGQLAMEQVDDDSLTAFLSTKGYTSNYDSHPQLDFHNTRDPLKWLTNK